MLLVVFAFAWIVERFFNAGDFFAVDACKYSHAGKIGLATTQAEFIRSDLDIDLFADRDQVFMRNTITQQNTDDRLHQLPTCS